MTARPMANTPQSNSGRWSASRRLATAMGVVVPAAMATVAATPAVASEPTDSNTVDAGSIQPAGAATLCQPIFGSGKIAGVPIVVEKWDGSLLTNKTGLTFELRNGSDYQDVTSLIKTVEEQPFVAGDPLFGYSYPIIEWLNYGPRTGRVSGFLNLSEIVNADGPTLDWSNPGYWFLDCTPDSGDATKSFPAGTELVALRDGVAIARGFVEGRAAAGEAAIFDATKPASYSPAALVQLYKDLVARTGVRLREPFLSLALTGLSGQPGAGPAICAQGLATVADGKWTWNAVALAWKAELTSTTETTYAVFNNRVTNGGTTNDPLCDVTAIEEYARRLIAVFVGQSVLVDGPRGRLNSDLVTAAPWLAPAVRLKAVRLPELGVNAEAPLTAAIVALGIGTVLLAVSSRRRRRPL